MLVVQPLSPPDGQFGHVTFRRKWAPWDGGLLSARLTSQPTWVGTSEPLDCICGIIWPNNNFPLPVSGDVYSGPLYPRTLNWLEVTSIFPCQYRTSFQSWKFLHQLQEPWVLVLFVCFVLLKYSWLTTLCFRYTAKWFSLHIYILFQIIFPLYKILNIVPFAIQ